MECSQNPKIKHHLIYRTVFDSSDYRREIAQQYQISGLFCNVRSIAHGYTTICGFERRGIIHAVTSDRDAVSISLESVDNPELLFRCGPCKDNLLVLAQLVELGGGEGHEFCPGEYDTLQRVVRNVVIIYDRDRVWFNLKMVDAMNRACIADDTRLTGDGQGSRRVITCK